MSISPPTFGQQGLPARTHMETIEVNIIYPTPIAYDAIDVAWIIGRRVTDITFQTPTFRFSLGDSEHIDVWCLWRIIRDGRIVLTSQDHDQRFGLPSPIDAPKKAMETLSDIPVTHARFREATADIYLDFGTELSLEIIPDSSGYESWQLYAPHGKRYVAQGDGQISTWTQ